MIQDQDQPEPTFVAVALAEAEIDAEVDHLLSLIREGVAIERRAAALEASLPPTAKFH